MAESKSRKSSSSKKSSASSRGRSSSSSGSKQRSSSSSNNSGNRRSPREIAIGAVEQMQELIGRPVESITGMEKDGKEWIVTIEVLELERVPTTTDVLGKYEVTLDENGELTGAQRTRRYPRAEAGEL
jgi:hypothetical protein